jgi:MOSC domain-containing protein YiiM
MGVVEGIHLAHPEGADTDSVERVRVHAGRGPVGDRHFRADGTEPNEPGMGHDLTLIEAEALEGLASDAGIALEPGEHLRNVVTRGVALNDLVGKPFRVGDVRCVGVDPCHPCRHLERLTKPGVLKGLAGRGGLRADVVRGGEIAVGDRVEPL